MGIEKLLPDSIKIPSAAIGFLTVVFAAFACADDTGNSTIGNIVERIDTVRVDDTAVVKDPSVMPASEPAPAVSNEIVHDSATQPHRNSSAVPEPFTITVSAKRPSGRDETARPTMVSGEDIRTTPRSTPLEALSQASSDVYITGRGTGLHGVSSGASGGIYIRGLGGSPNSQILVVEDGVPDYQGIFGHPVPDAFFPSLIDRVAIVKGGDGSLYGTNAMGGVIVVDSRWPDTAGARLENDAAFGSFNTFRDNSTLLYKGKGVDAVSAFSAFSTNGHRDGTGGNSQAGQIGVRFRLPRASSLTLRDKYIHLQGADPGDKDHPHPGNSFDVVRNTMNMRFDATVGSIKVRIIPWLNAGEHRLFDGFFSRDYTAGCIAEAGRGLFGSRLALIAGVAYDRIDGIVEDRTPDSGYVAPVIGPVSSVAPYCQATVVPLPGLTVVLGGRLYFSSKYRGINMFAGNTHDTLPFEPLYKAGVLWNPVSWGGIHARVTRNLRQPTLRELYLPFPVANPGLRPEHALNADVGLDFTPGAMRFSVSAYRTHAKDLIKYFGMWPGAEVVNIDEIVIPGFEADFQVPFGDRLKLSGSVCRQDVGRFTKQNPDAKANAGLIYHGKLKNGTVDLSLSGEWVGGLFMNNYKADTVRMKDVRFVDGSVRFNLYTSKGLAIEPYCIIRNLFDVPYEYIFNYPMPGVNLLAGLRIKV